ncbi:MAG: hypothetical protein ACOC2I_01815 [Halanaerobium sp.]
MDKSFYSLSHNPFRKEIETKNLYQSQNLKELTARLNYLKKTRGIAAIVGEQGSGKTSALRAMADDFNPSLFKVIYFPLSTGSGGNHLKI